MVTVCTSCGFEAERAFKFCPECGAPAVAPAPAREQRKVVTVLFCDVTGSTPLGERLDPESLRSLLARYFERMRAIVEAHGGTVEKFIGDAVMAVFGVPVLHEDDALRACRAAVEMRDALPELGVQGRIGVTTGEVVTGTEERLATGDPVNVAARLEQAAAPGEVLIGDETWRLVRDAVEAEPVEPLALKGKSDPVPAFRLLAAAGELRRGDAAPMVGRERQRRRLAEAFAAVTADRACHLFTVLGAAGVGKSRLVREFLADLGATVAVGRCRSYGEGMTFAAVVELLQQLEVRPVEEAAAATVASLLGESEEPASVDEIAWAVRKTLEAAAAERPLVCVLDDVHWGEAALLDLIEHVADWSRDAPVLLVCMARPELLERRPAWAGGKLNATTVLLEPLTGEETGQLIEALLGEAPISGDLRRRIAEAAEGNPLFVEEMLALVRESGDDEVTVPPSIQALLAARLDQLDPAERAVLERGAIEGRLFHRGAVAALHPDEPQLPVRLMALVRKELVRPDQPRLPGDDAFRFRHLLIRDAAYEALPKSLRAELHERFAGWLASHGDLLDLDEVVGYHLEQACRYRTELGRPVDAAVAAEARRRLTAAARRALAQRDAATAQSLLDRAAALLAPGEVDAVLEFDLIEAPLVAGRLSDAHAQAAAALERARAGGDGQTGLYLEIFENLVAVFAEQRAVEQLAELAERALPTFAVAGHDLGLCLCYRAAGAVAYIRGRVDACVAAVDQALEHARRAGLPHTSMMAFPSLAAHRLAGTTPVGELLEWLGEQRKAGNHSPALRVNEAEALAMLGRFDESRTILRDARDELEDRGDQLLLTLALARAGAVELLAGNPAAAGAFLEQACSRVERIYDGRLTWYATVYGHLAAAYYALGDLDRAQVEAERVGGLGDGGPVVGHMPWRQVKAKVLARRGQYEEAERLAREAVAIGEQTQLLNAQADAHRDLAEVLHLGGEQAGARQMLATAIDRYRQKGNLAALANAERLLPSLA